jgi:hypothetical protein
MMNPIGIGNEHRIGFRDPSFDDHTATAPVLEHGGADPGGTRVRRSAWPGRRSATGRSCGRPAPAGSGWTRPSGTTARKPGATHAGPVATRTPSSAPPPGRAPPGGPDRTATRACVSAPRRGSRVQRRPVPGTGRGPGFRDAVSAGFLDPAPAGVPGSDVGRVPETRLGASRNMFGQIPGAWPSIPGGGGAGRAAGRPAGRPSEREVSAEPSVGGHDLGVPG